MKKFASALPKNQTLRTLSLFDNNIGNEGAKQLADMLKVNTSIQEMYLGYNNIGDEGAKQLGGALAKNKTLRKLRLYYTKIGDEGAEVLADMIKGNTSIQEIDLGYNDIGDEGAKCLGGALANNKTLKVLLLNFNKIGDNGAEHLAHSLMANNTLQTIVLYDNTIGDKGAESLATAILVNQGLSEMYLGSNMIGDPGAEELADALECNNNIRTLSLEGNDNICNYLKKKIKASLSNSTGGKKELTSKQSRKVIAMKDEMIQDNDDTEIAKNDKSLKAFVEETSSNKRARTEDNTTKAPKIHSVQLDYDEHLICFICKTKYSCDMDNNKTILHLPVLSQSQTKDCDHYFCLGCVRNHQAALTGNSVPRWIPCMTCRTKTAFRPGSPKYHKTLIGLLKQSKWIDAPVPVKEELLD